MYIQLHNTFLLIPAMLLVLIRYSEIVDTIGLVTMTHPSWQADVGPMLGQRQWDNVSTSVGPTLPSDVGPT